MPTVELFIARTAERLASQGLTKLRPRQDSNLRHPV